MDWGLNRGVREEGGREVSHRSFAALSFGYGNDFGGNPSSCVRARARVCVVSSTEY